MSPICLPHSGCSNARLGPLVLHVILICLPLVSHLSPLTLVWDPWFYSSYSFVSHLSPICLPHSGCSNARLGPLVLHVILICLPLVSHILDALTLVWDPWFYTSYSFVSHLSPICLPHSGCSNARLGPLVLLVIPQTALAEGFLICLKEKDSVTLIWISHGTTLKTTTHLSPTCLPFVSHILDALTLVSDPWFCTSYSFFSHLSPICLPHSGCSNARLGPLVLHVLLICLPLVSHLSPTFWML